MPTASFEKIVAGISGREGAHLTIVRSLGLLGLLFCLYLTSLYSYLLFHSVAEVFSLVIAFSIFVIAWNARSRLDNNYLLFTGIAYFFVSGLDLVHTLSYKGMGVFPGYDANLPTQLWIAARYLQAITLVLAALFVRRGLEVRDVFLTYTAASAALLWLIFGRSFPDCFIEGKGLTPFKIWSEYVISSLFVLAAVLLYKRKADFDASVLGVIFASVAATVVSELAFTRYVSVYGFANLFGHMLRIIAFYLMYRALVVTGIVRPYDLIYRSLKQGEEALKKSNEELERRVKKRTEELVRVNEELQREMEEKTKTAEALRVSEATLAHAQKVARLGSWEWEIATNQLAWSDEIYRIFGLQPHECGADYSTFMKAVHPADRDAVQRAVHDALENRRPYSIDHRVVLADGTEKIVHEQGETIADASGTVIRMIGTVQDITEMKRLEEQFRHSQKLEAVGLLAGGVAHDFNNILTAIIGYASLLQMRREKPETIGTYAEEILAAAERASYLTQSLLLFSRKQDSLLKQVNLNDIIRVTDKLLRRIIGEDVELALSLADHPLIVMADSGQIDQVLMNLCTNARDAMPRGGRITVETSSIQTDRAFFPDQPPGQAGHYAVLAVSDTGCGMDDLTRQKIFEPFFTTKEPGKGTGLGLSIIYGIVRQHGGFITVDSSPGAGTIFRIYLPLLGDAAAETAAPAQPAATQNGGTETILVAEDDVVLGRLIRTVLSDFGYSVILTHDGEGAVAQFSENRERIRLAVIDLVMPKKGGLEAYAEMKMLVPSLRVLFMSGYAATVLRTKIVLGEGTDYIAKPVSPRDLLQKVREILERPEAPSGARSGAV